MAGTSGHLADQWLELTEKESQIKKDKERLKTLILLTNQSTIYGTTANISVKHITTDRFDSGAFQKADPLTAKQFRMTVSSTRIDISKK